MHNFCVVIVTRALFFDRTTPRKKHRRGAFVMGASIWIQAIRGYLHFLCPPRWLFDMRMWPSVQLAELGLIQKPGLLGKDFFRTGGLRDSPATCQDG